MTSKLNQTQQPAHPTAPQKNMNPTPIPVRHHDLVESFEIMVKLSPRRPVVVIARVLVAVQVEVPVVKVWVVVMAEVITIVKEEENVDGMIGGVADDGKAGVEVDDVESLV